MPFFSSTLFREESSDAAFRHVLKEILSGPEVEAVEAGAEQVQFPTNELLAYRFEITDPRHRIVANEVYTLNLSVAVARFVWMISGNNRLADIAFYEPRVKAFSDDSIIVPGSSYGTRIRQAVPGIDQLQGVIDRLQDDVNSRRAAISIYQPTDTTRVSKDIPCAFGLMFHIRGKRLHTQLIMRSNNATTLLPFNLFEFSLLAEVVAAECRVEMGPLSYYAASMHIYEGLRDFSYEIINDGKSTQSEPMLPIPNDPAPLKEICKLVQYEAEIRHRSEAIDDNMIEEEIEIIRERLAPYWQQLAFLLLAKIVDRRCSMDGANKLIDVISDELEKHLTWENAEGNEPMGTPSGETILGHAKNPDNIVNLYGTEAMSSFKQTAIQYEKRYGRLPAQELLELAEHHAEQIAARGLDLRMRMKDFTRLLQKLRTRNER